MELCNDAISDLPQVILGNELGTLVSYGLRIQPTQLSGIQAFDTESDGGDIAINPGTDMLRYRLFGYLDQ